MPKQKPKVHKYLSIYFYFDFVFLFFSYFVFLFCCDFLVTLYPARRPKMSNKIKSNKQ